MTDQPQQKRKLRGKVNLSTSKATIVKQVLADLGFEEVEDPDEDQDWVLLWTDQVAPMSTVLQLKQHQRCNHFIGTLEIARKDNLGRNMNRMAKAYPEEYNFFPQTFTLPTDFGELRNLFHSKKNTFIVKPDASSQGKGIYLTRSIDEIDPMGHNIVQHYIAHPLLIEEMKFDLRVYVLVTSCDPLRIFLYKDGLARFATEKYVAPSSQNLDRTYMHLTNYSINKNSENFVVDKNDRSGKSGTKRSIVSVMETLQKEGYDVEKIWDDIADIIVKTLIAIQPQLSHLYNTCFPNDMHGNCVFELMGFDILFQKKKDGSIKSWLLEVNHAPSMNIDTPFDQEIKYRLLTDIFRIVNLRDNQQRKTAQNEKTKAQERLHGSAKVKPSKQEEELAKIKNKEEFERKELKRSKNTNFVMIFPSERRTKFASMITPVAVPETAASIARKESIQKQQEEKKKNEVWVKPKRIPKVHNVQSSEQPREESLIASPKISQPEKISSSPIPETKVQPTYQAKPTRMQVTEQRNILPQLGFEKFKLKTIHTEQEETGLQNVLQIKTLNLVIPAKNKS